MYETTPPTLTADRICGKITECTVGSTYETTKPTATTDRICSNVAICAVGTSFEKSPPTLTSNRECDSVTSCTLGSTYETTKPTAAHDRICSPVSTCTSPKHIANPATLNSDLACCDQGQVWNEYTKKCQDSEPCPDIQGWYGKDWEHWSYDEDDTCLRMRYNPSSLTRVNLSGPVFDGKDKTIKAFKDKLEWISGNNISATGGKKSQDVCINTTQPVSKNKYPKMHEDNKCWDLILNKVYVNDKPI